MKLKRARHVFAYGVRQNARSMRNRYGYNVVVVFSKTAAGGSMSPNKRVTSTVVFIYFFERWNTQFPVANFRHKQRIFVVQFFFI